jgi:hypothetical protein
VSVGTLLLLICIDYGVVRGGLEGPSHDGGHGHNEHGHSHAVPVLPDTYIDAPPEGLKQPPTTEAPLPIPMPQPYPTDAKPASRGRSNSHSNSHSHSHSHSTDGNLKLK